ncbi:sulfatase-like hydrolase/transferase [Halococcus sp. PRR34]|uniref:sulfatase-like hydrolase/transferase n=1 Tax=Halococcus sp. PRR34 TaxID=3020830 RepID=UPI0023614048|nr:sulfatase-like hydrolase/transferase [Halococcus sp. PRR34]
MTEERNVVLICLDTVRKDFFDEMADSLLEMADLRYDQCRAASSWSVPSHGSMFTGQLPHEHGVHAYNSDFSTLDDENVWLTDLDDHVTMNISANVWLTRSFGINKFFDKQIDIASQQRFKDGMNVKEFKNEENTEGWQMYAAFIQTALQHDYPIQSLINGIFGKTLSYIRHTPVPTPVDDGATRIIKESLKQIDTTEEPFFLFQNFMDAHGPLHHVWGHNQNLHDVPLSWSSNDLDAWNLVFNQNDDVSDCKHGIRHYRELYRTAIDYLDRKISSFISTVQNQTDRETTFVITADHGENLAYPADDWTLNHASSLSEGLLHVPLCVINPPKNNSTVIDGFVSHLQLGKLIMGLADGKVDKIQNEPIAAELIGGSPQVRKRAKERDEIDYWDRMQRCAYKDETKYLWDSLGATKTLDIDFHKSCWQQERIDESQVPEWASMLFRTDIETYDQISDSEMSANEFPNAIRDQLKNLGYI